jgi:hypothetical protein
LYYGRNTIPHTGWSVPKQQRDFPNLSKMALDTLSIPAMATSSKRLFSSTGLTVTNRRNRLILIQSRPQSVSSPRTSSRNLTLYHGFSNVATVRCGHWGTRTTAYCWFSFYIRLILVILVWTYTVVILPCGCKVLFRKVCDHGFLHAVLDTVVVLPSS